ncbi:Exocyst complex component 7 [Exaiptasia diaphana]|nr:Exocyst complex component 7 [Exaiptasia diaphana]
MTIVSTLKRFITKHNYSSVMQAFPILKHFRFIQPLYDDVLQNTSSKTRQQFPTLIWNLELTVSRGLEEFADGIKHGPDKHSNMPKDGTVHELTRNTLIFMDQLLPYVETVGNVLATQQEDQMGGVIYRDEGQLTRITAEYVQRVLGSLGLNLQLKAKFYESMTLSALFLLNNHHYILKTLQRSGLTALLKDGEINDIEGKYQNLIEEQKNMYEKCWTKVLNYLLEMDKPGASPKSTDGGAKLKDKQRQTIKDKFKGFNTEFDEIYQLQKTFAVPDEQLREEIRKKNIDLIVPLYTTFREKYEGVQFTKNPEKYVKYSPEEVENLMKKFFDVSA